MKVVLGFIVYQNSPRRSSLKKRRLKGETTNTGVKANEEINYLLHFIIPWEDDSAKKITVSHIFS
ncbi:hypothetical protein H8E88_27725 [candidate division KSB1 bacterium]|nr:hypothetical protein [candidate division KSB1 bacterium]